MTEEFAEHGGEAPNRLAGGSLTGSALIGYVPDIGIRRPAKGE
jgi:hypothetical protein